MNILRRYSTHHCEHVHRAINIIASAVIGCRQFACPFNNGNITLTESTQAYITHLWINDNGIRATLYTQVRHVQDFAQIIGII